MDIEQTTEKEREVDRIIAVIDDLVKERDKYKKELEDLKERVTMLNSILEKNFRKD